MWASTPSALKSNTLAQFPTKKMTNGSVVRVSLFEQVQLVNQGDQEYRDHNDGGERWKKSKGTSSVERAELDPVRFLKFADQEGRDQKS